MKLKALTINTEEKGYDSEGRSITKFTEFEALELSNGTIIVPLDSDFDMAFESRDEISAFGDAVVTSVEESGDVEKDIDSIVDYLVAAYSHNQDDYIEEAIEWLQGQVSTAEALVIADQWERETNPDEYELNLFEAMGELHPLTCKFEAKWPSGFKCKAEFCPEEGNYFIFDDLSVLTLETIYWGRFSGKMKPKFDDFVTLEDIVKGQALKIEEDHPDEDLSWESYEIKDGIVIFK